MPPHLKQRAGSRNYYIVDGRHVFTTKTTERGHAEILLEQYRRDRLGIPKRLDLDAKGKAATNRFGQPDYQSSMRKLRFPCVYAFIRDGTIVYVGSSINGFGRILASNHPMVANAHDTDEIVFWTCTSEVDAREMEVEMIRMLRPQFNLTIVGRLKRKGIRQRAQDPEHVAFRKMIKTILREELQALVTEGLFKTA